MSELIERLKAATGPDRRLDAEIFLAVHPGWERVTSDAFWNDATKEAMNASDVPRYTESVDDALTLIPEGCGAVDIELRGEFNHVTIEWAGGEATADNAPSPALAICITAMEARNG